jgi:hypothetical protein
MSLFGNELKSASVYHIDDSDTTKTSTYPGTADFTIDMFIIRRNEDTVAILGQELGEFVSNVEGTNASNIVKGDKIVWDSKTYIVTNTPRKNFLFNRYKVLLRKQT